MFLILLITSIFTLTPLNALCLHLQPNLKRWSDPKTWNGTVPEVNASVTVTRDVLLDMKTPRLFSVTIQPGASLVFSPDVPLASISAHYVHVRGRLDIGANDCRFKGQAEIFLTGKIDDHPAVPDMGLKFLGVPEGGRLEIHGEEKLSWTKLTKTLQKSTDISRQNVAFDQTIYSNNTSTSNGLWIYAFDSKTGQVTASGLGVDNPQQFGMFIAGVPSSAVLMFAIKDTWDTDGLMRDKIADLFEIFVYGRITGGSKLRRVRPNQAWVCIAMRANGTEMANSRMTNVQFLTRQIAGLTYSVTSRIIKNGANELPVLQFRVFGNPPMPLDENILDLLDDATSWRPGDEIVIASTDYDWKQAEVVTVISCATCSQNQVKVKGLVKYTHWGEISHNIDMRAEVALLTRSIKIHGEMQQACYEPQNCDHFSFDTFGGHIKIVKGFENVHIQGAEVYHMGQQSFIGNYPIHFHLVEEVDDRVDPPYVRSNSIHHTFARCVTVHGTHGLMVENNIAYDHLGHCYFLEDGGEKRTVFDGNLAIGTRKAFLIPSDSGPASFWITNPLTVLRNNVAAGSEHSGIWYLFPEEPVVLSYGKGWMKKDEARHTKILEFYNNVAHSNLNMGLFFEGKLGRDHSVDTFNNGYNARKDPLDPNSEPDTIEFMRFTGYKNRMQNAWVRGNNVIVSQSSFADSLKGLTFALGGRGVQQLVDSVIIGESDNTGEPSRFLLLNGTMFEWSRALPLPGLCCYHLPTTGFIFNEGPVHLRRVWFDRFTTNPIRNAGALSFLPENNFFSSPVSSVSSISFGYSDPESGNYIFDETDGEIGNKRTNTFRDLDGSVTGTVNSTVLRINPFVLTKYCAIHNTWNSAVCPHKYFKLRFFWHTVTEPYKVYLTRDDHPERLETYAGIEHTVFQLTPVLTYIVHFNGTIPRKFSMVGIGLEGGLGQRLGICLPPGGSFILKSTIANGFIEAASSLSEVDKDLTGRKYFWDSPRGILFLKMVNPYPRDSESLTDCPGISNKHDNPCPTVEIQLTGGDLNAGNCLARAYPTYTMQNMLITQTSISTPKMHIRRTYPPAYGAGSTRPFTVTSIKSSM